MRLTKSDFISYLNCPKSLWLAKRGSERYPQQSDPPVFMQKLAREGYEVEGYVRQFFDMASGHNVEFQCEFETKDGLFAKADAIEKTVDGKTFLYEVKSSTSVKTEVTHSHIKDVCFQKICAERSGQRIDRVFLIHLNGEYVRNGAIEPTKLLTVVDVTRDAEAMASETEVEIDAALDFFPEI
jgi:CRISPR/Cas system-associated exonuclease Cas4 (RecB family)